MTYQFYFFVSLKISLHVNKEARTKLFIIELYVEQQIGNNQNVIRREINGQTMKHLRKTGSSRKECV